MSPLELLLPEAPSQSVPFSVRLAERRRGIPISLPSARSDRRAHLRRSVSDLEWLRSVRITQGFDVRLIDLSEGGALIEIDSPIKPGTNLTLELSGTGLETMVPLEVVRCYISNLRGDIALYRGACAFEHLIELPGRTQAHRDTPEPLSGFVGTDAALAHLLNRITGSQPTNHEPRTTDTGLRLERADLLQVLKSLQMRRSTDQSDPHGRYAAQLLSAILPLLERGAPREVTVGVLADKLRELPDRWRARMEPTRGRLIALIDHCAPPSTIVSPRENTSADAASAGGFQKIVVRYIDGDLVKGFTQDFHPSRPQFSLWPSINASKSERLVIPMGRLKAVFFVRDFNGNAGYRERKTFATRNGHGRRLEVTFLDNETVLGTTLNYRPDGQGFFLIPVDTSANNSRIFVVASAVRRVRFL
jgi:uncharacterized protein DUF6982/PilZ domain-containing protein